MSLLPTESILASGHFNTWWLDSYELIEGRGKAECCIYSCATQAYNKTAYAWHGALSVDVLSDLRCTGSFFHWMSHIVFSLLGDRGGSGHISQQSNALQ